MLGSAKPSGLSRKQIEEEANRILQRHGLTSIPIDPVTLANREGIKVHNAKFAKPNISGLIAKRGNASSVLVENDDSPTRKRFTIAHELGHFFLHLRDGGEFVDTPVDLQRTSVEDGAKGAKQLEIEANQFAAALLMPEDRIRELHRSIVGVTDLARMFRVSEEAMAIRLGTLGLQ